MFELVNAGELSETEAIAMLEKEARDRNHAPQNIKATILSARRRTAGKVAHIPESARKNNGATHKSAPESYANLTAYEQSRGVPSGTNAAAGWFDTPLWEYEYTDRKTGEIRTTFNEKRPATFLRERRAIGFSTPAGPRYRLIDDLPGAKYWHPHNTHTDENKTWYQLGKAIEITLLTGQPMVLCNGEGSVVAA